MTTRVPGMRPSLGSGGDRRPGAIRAPDAGPLSGALRAAEAPDLLRLSDRASRGSMLAGLQRLGGNHAVQRLVASQLVATPEAPRVQRAPGEGEEGAPGGGSAELAPNPYEGPTIARPDLAANPYTEENESVTLTNERFSGISGLGPIARGERALSARDNGPAVKAVQQALLDLGYELLRHQQDGSFGGETASAITLFRQDRDMGPGELTAKALGELDSLAPPPGVRREHFLDYDRLFADGRLDVTFAIGYDEGGSHKAVIEEARTGLEARGFTAESPEEGKPADRYTAHKSVSYPTSDGGRTTKDITVVVSIISPGEGSAAKFGKALSESELTVYAGHARRGIGPDFDADKSPAENFVIGVNSALHAAGKAIAPSAVEQHHYVIDKVNDLEEMTKNKQFDPEKYRVWFFDACISVAYMDELRGGILPEGMGRENLDIFGTRKTVPWAVGLAADWALLDGILAAQTTEQIVTQMVKIGSDKLQSLDAPNASKQRAIRELQNAYWREGAATGRVAEGSP